MRVDVGGSLALAYTILKRLLLMLKGPPLCMCAFLPVLRRVRMLCQQLCMGLACLDGRSGLTGRLCEECAVVETIKKMPGLRFGGVVIPTM